VIEKVALEEYQTDTGKIPFRDWLNALKDVTGRMAIRTRLNRIQYFGNFGDHKPVGVMVVPGISTKIGLASRWGV